MDQKKIGAFIAKCRKEKKMTQVELAEKLGVTDKSISNWENARCMPDLSLFKPLCDALDITINELISGEKAEKELSQEKCEDNIIKTINYSYQKIKTKEKNIGFIILITGLFISFSAVAIFPSESSWCAIYSLVGAVISLIGVLLLFKHKSIQKRIIIGLSYFVVLISLFLGLDYINVIHNYQPPRFSYSIETGDDMIVYKAPFCHVYRINRDTQNEYYIIDTKKQYTEKTVPVTPFNRDKSGIDHIIQYQNLYLGHNSNIGNLLNSLPLAEYGYVFEIDAQNLSLTVDYHITDWYINEDDYLEKSLLYNAVSIFMLIDNVNEIHFQFSGHLYTINRKQCEQYPHYDKIKDDKIDKNHFNQYVEKKMNDNDFVHSTFQMIFNNED